MLPERHALLMLAGIYVSMRGQDKLSPLTKNIFMLRSGSVADSTTVASETRLMLQRHEAELGEDCDVRTAAHLVHQILYRNKDQLQVQAIVAGWDKTEGGQVFAVPPGGTFIEVPYALGGSGSAYIYGWCDKRWRNGMTEEECKEFVFGAVAKAIARDSASGGGIRTRVFTSTQKEPEFTPWDKIRPQLGELRAPQRLIA
eukprot:evm.model.scf_2445.1 EVM.evm.TU.scf_2445.1   scf_2445:2715-3314(-)